MFKKATKQQAKLRMAISGPAGSGKTFSALSIGSHLGKKVALIDTERGSASKYSDKFSFDVCELERFNPRDYIAAIKDAEQNGYDVIVIDSLSHAWNGEGGLLEMVGGNFNNWKTATPLQNQLVSSIVGSRCHIIATMRTKQEYVVEEVNGKKTPRKVGLAPVQRDDTQYEFDVHGVMDQAHSLSIDKTRCDDLDSRSFSRPGKDVADILLKWLGQGTAPATVVPFQKPQEQAPVVEEEPISKTEETIARAMEYINAVEANPIDFPQLASVLKKLLDPLSKEQASDARKIINPKYQELKKKLADLGKVA